MKILAISDIHNNLVAVRKLRAFTRNSFDAIIVAGDIGNEAAVATFQILVSFRCPIMYVFGNWDHKLSYRRTFNHYTRLIHLNVCTMGGLNFTGFSGCPTNWGKNPIARKSHNSSINSSILELNRQAAKEAVQRAAIDPQSTIVVTHERFGHLQRYVPGALLHIYGHIHQFSERVYKGTKYVNVAALDRQISVRPRGRKRWLSSDCRNLNAGNYSIIEIDRSRQITVSCHHLPHDYADWIILQDRRFNGIDWITEEQKWTNRSDPKLLKYEVVREKRELR